MIDATNYETLTSNMPPRGRAWQEKRSAFTLVELLVVIFIIGLLVAILLPAIQSAREASRRSACANHLRQLAIAALHHLDKHGHFPTGGWGHGWTGDPERGVRRGQPGGWIYNLLPYLEESALHDRGAGLPLTAKRTAAAQVMGQPLAVLNCPTRRASITYPNNSPRKFYNAEVPAYLARADYAANCGDRGQNVLNNAGGPSTLEEGDGTYNWPNRALYTGICFVRSEVAGKQVADGMSKTYMLGEKYVNPQLYESGDDPSDWGHMYVGHGAETLRLAKAITPPMMDRFPISQLSHFGSAHVGSFYMAFCDASVRAVSYDIDPEMYQRLGNRGDHEVTVDSSGA